MQTKFRSVKRTPINQSARLKSYRKAVMDVNEEFTGKELTWLLNILKDA